MSALGDRVVGFVRRVTRTLPQGEPGIPAVIHRPGTRDLEQGDTGADVRYLQVTLGGYVDSVYGPETAWLVRGFSHRLLRSFPTMSVDGTVTKITWLALGVPVRY